MFWGGQRGKVASWTLRPLMQLRFRDEPNQNTVNKPKHLFSLFSSSCFSFCFTQWKMVTETIDQIYIFYNKQPDWSWTVPVLIPNCLVQFGHTPSPYPINSGLEGRSHIVPLWLLFLLQCGCNRGGEALWDDMKTQ